VSGQQGRPTTLSLFANKPVQPRPPSTNGRTSLSCWQRCCCPVLHAPHLGVQFSYHVPNHKQLVFERGSICGVKITCFVHHNQPDGLSSTFSHLCLMSTFQFKTLPVKDVPHCGDLPRRGRRPTLTRAQL
jgi:hypothetical protein